MSRCLQYIYPQVSMKSWYNGLDIRRDFIKVLPYVLGSLFYRIGLTDNNRWNCGVRIPICQLCGMGLSWIRYYQIRLICFPHGPGESEMLAIRDVLGKPNLSFWNLSSISMLDFIVSSLFIFSMCQHSCIMLTGNCSIPSFNALFVFPLVGCANRFCSKIRFVISLQLFIISIIRC